MGGPGQKGRAMQLASDDSQSSFQPLIDLAAQITDRVFYVDKIVEQRSVTVIRVGWRRLRPIGASMVPESASGWPHTIAA